MNTYCKGYWKNGKLDGKGELFNSQTMWISGNLKNHKVNGFAIIWYDKFSLEIYGNFIDNLISGMVQKNEYNKGVNIVA